MAEQPTQVLDPPTPRYSPPDPDDNYDARVDELEVSRKIQSDKIDGLNSALDVLEEVVEEQRQSNEGEIEELWNLVRTLEEDLARTKMFMKRKYNPISCDTGYLCNNCYHYYTFTSDDLLKCKDCEIHETVMTNNGAGKVKVVKSEPGPKKFKVDKEKKEYTQLKLTVLNTPVEGVVARLETDLKELHEK